MAAFKEAMAGTTALIVDVDPEIPPATPSLDVTNLSEAIVEAIMWEWAKFALWGLSYATLAALYIPAQIPAWIPLWLNVPGPVVGTGKVVVTLACAGFSICAALQLNPASADPMPASALQSYKQLDELSPFLARMRWINLVVMLVSCGRLISRIWA